MFGKHINYTRLNFGDDLVNTNLCLAWSFSLLHKGKNRDSQVTRLGVFFLLYKNVDFVSLVVGNPVHCFVDICRVLVLHLKTREKREINTKQYIRLTPAFIMAPSL